MNLYKFILWYIIIYMYNKYYLVNTTKNYIVVIVTPK